MSNNSKIYSDANGSTNFLRHDSLPWPKWSDNDFNSEQWNNSRGSSTYYYDDPQPVVLPSSLKPHKWSRPHEINNLKPIIYSASSSSSPNNYPNLFKNNQHLLISEFMRWFISSVTILSYYGRKGLEVTESSGFSWNFENKPWHGSLHIYSMNKAGYGVEHNPQINPRGRYIARLFFMGCWRRIEIDDLIPIDNEGKSLLPYTENYHELWSILLAKAMLKIAALSWTSSSEINDFNPILCLTGWSCISLSITHLSPNDRWELLTRYSDKFKLTSTLENQPVELEKPGKTLKKQKERSKRKNSTQIEEKMKEKNYFPIMTLLYIPNVANNLKKISNAIIPNYPTYVESTSDIKSDPALIKPPLKSWKLHRWLPWAIRQGIIDPADYFIPTRRIFLLNPTNVTLINEDKKLSSIWLDFNKLSDYPMNIYIFFIPKYFKCCIEVADVLPDELHKDKREKLNNESRVAIKKMKESEFYESKRVKKHYQYSHIGIQSRNEPLYLFIDSIHSKFLLFDFSTLPEPGRNSSLIIDRHCWFKRPLENEALLEIKTITRKCKALYLNSGRHLLRIFCQSNNSYHLIILSDTNFHIGNRKQMYKLMQIESERIKALADKIINSMSDAFNSFGSSNYRINLKYYYRCYMPEKKYNQLKIYPYKLIHDYFHEELIKLIIKKGHENILEAMRIFFCNPEIRKNFGSFDNSDTMESVPNPSIDDIKENFGEDADDYYHDRIIINATITIQAFWRMARVKLYKKIHHVNNKRHKEIKKILQQIILDIMDVNFVCNLVRNFIKRCDNLSDLYPCSSDLQKVLEIQEIKGCVSSIIPHQWIPIVHQTLNVPSDSIVFACLDLFVDLPVYILQVFNNDTGRELQRIVNNVIPFHYKRKKKGYTVVGYGWNFDNRVNELKWSLQLTTIKGDPQLIFFNEDKLILSPVEIPPLQIHELSNVYIPNIYNLIFKVILIMNDGWISLRVHTTYDKVKIKLKIKNNNDEIVKEISGRSTIILPVLNLEAERNKWIIEAVVLSNSWPLTVDEWDIVAKAKKMEQTKMRKQSTVSLGKTPQSQQILTNLFDSPLWYLQIVSDDGRYLELYQDTSRQIEIEKFKELWNLNDCNRIKRGKKIREEFLNKNCKLKKLNQNKIYSLKPPQNYEIPPLNLSKFFINNYNKNRQVKSESDDEFERTQRERKIIEFQETYTNFIERSNTSIRELQLNVALSSRIPTKRNM